MTRAVLYNHTATLLEDGRVLVTGGQTTVTSRLSPPGIVSAEIYDPSTGSWSPTRPMFDPRRHHGAVLLEDGRVLVSGGLTEEHELFDSIASAEVYDPFTETWSFVGDMPEEKGLHSLERLENGAVLAIGGFSHSVGLYDPSSGIWTSPGGPATSRECYTHALLGNGKVLLMGWSDYAELWDPLTGLSSSTGSRIEAWEQAMATVLADGSVLVTGGNGHVGSALGPLGPLASAEIYDPTSETWSEAGEMTRRRVNHTMTVLSDGRVLVVGGSPNRATEIYDPSTDIWSKAALTIERRKGHTATLLKDGRVLVVGGARGSRAQPFDVTSAEVYDPATDTWMPSTEAAR